MSNVILPVQYSNPMAQAWRLPSFEAPEVNLRYTYGPSFTVAAGTVLYDQPIPINSNADFITREFAFDIGAANPGTIRVRFKDMSGQRQSRDMLAIEELRGPLPLSWRLPRVGQIKVDIQNTGGSDISVQVILKGVEVFQPLGINTCMPGFEPEDYVPLYERYSIPPPGWHDEPSDQYFEITRTASQNRINVLQMPTDADFYWRGITGYNNTGDGVGLLKLLFSDAWDNQLSSAAILQGNEIGVAPQARPVYPEVCCPAYSILNVQATEYTANACKLRYALRGVLRYRD